MDFDCISPALVIKLHWSLWSSPFLKETYGGMTP